MPLSLETLFDEAETLPAGYLYWASANLVMAVVELAFFLFGDALKLHSSNSSSSSFCDSCIKLLRLADTYSGDDLPRSLSIASSISSCEEES